MKIIYSEHVHTTNEQLQLEINHTTQPCTEYYFDFKSHMMFKLIYLKTKLVNLWSLMDVLTVFSCKQKECYFDVPH